MNTSLTKADGSTAMLQSLSEHIHNTRKYSGMELQVRGLVATCVFLVLCICSDEGCSMAAETSAFVNEVF